MTTVTPLRPPRPCPRCGEPAERAGRAYPFCSVRCADLDLGRWFDGTYTVPMVEEDRGRREDERDDD